MPKYRVHVYPVVRTVFEVEAESQADAIKKAEEEFSQQGLYGQDDLPEYADEITAFLVDEEGDDEYERTRWYKGDGTLDESIHRKVLAS